MCAETEERRRRMYFHSTNLANPKLVSAADAASCRPSSDFAKERQSFNNMSVRKTSSVAQKVDTHGMSFIRQLYKDKNISAKATNILLSSWRFGTKKQYCSYIKKWKKYCGERQISPVCSSLNYILDFLTFLFESNLGYSSINTARSALSAIGIVIDGFAAGSHPLVIRFLKGVYNLRPPMPCYVKTWDVSKVLSYLKTLSPVRYLSLKNLTLKLAMLICLIICGRTQSVHLLSIKNMIDGNDSCILQYRENLKQSRPGMNNPVVEIKAYRKDMKLCAVTVLREYIKRTASLRKNNTDLFISYVRPHKSVTVNTISRWLRTVMIRAGIDIKKYCVHSIRSATAAKAKSCMVPVNTILTSVGWSNAKTFGKFYDKQVEVQQCFQSAILS